MGSTRRSQPGESAPRAALTRRRLLGASGAAGSAVIVGAAGSVPASAQTPGALTRQERELVLQVARAGAVYPVEFPEFGESGRAVGRATPARLRSAERRLSAQRRKLVRAGAADLISRRLLGAGQARLLSGIGRRAVEAGPSELRAVEAVVSLAVATVSEHFDPNADHPAQAWIGGLRLLHERGRQPTPVRRLRPP